MDKYETLPFTVAPLGYLETSDQWTKEKPYYISGPLPPEMEAKRSNIRYKDGLTKFYNLRGHEHTLNMDEHGIEIHRVPSKVPVSLDFKAQDNTAAYMEETGKWLKDKFNAKAVLCYAYRYRTTDHSDEIMAHEHDIGSKLKPDSATGHPHTGNVILRDRVVPETDCDRSHARRRPTQGKTPYDVRRSRRVSGPNALQDSHHDVRMKV
jgi:hypothetical protein